jgi:hypothetical protein
LNGVKSSGGRVSTLKEIADHLKTHYTIISKVVAKKAGAGKERRDTVMLNSHRSYRCRIAGALLTLLEPVFENVLNSFTPKKELWPEPSSGSEKP